MSYTIVTGLVDIGRHEWHHDFRRTFGEYLQHFQNVLRIDAPMVVFVQKGMRGWVEEQREWHGSTEVVEVEVGDDDFVLHRHLDEMRKMQEDPEYAAACVEPTCPEASVPMYNVIVNNKAEFMARAAGMDPWGTEYFVWLDAGYGHSKFYIPQGQKVDLDLRLEKAGLGGGKVVINTLADKVKGDDYWSFFRAHQDFMDGGLVVMRGDTACRFRDVYYRIVEEAMSLGITDDDQYHMTMVYLKHPELFELVRIPGWAFRSVVILGK